MRLDEFLAEMEKASVLFDKLFDTMDDDDFSQEAFRETIKGIEKGMNDEDHIITLFYDEFGKFPCEIKFAGSCDPIRMKNAEDLYNFLAERKVGEEWCEEDKRSIQVSNL